MLELRPTSFDHPDAVRLRAELDRYYVAVYGEGDAHTVGAEVFAPPHGLFVVGFLDGVPVACGGWRTVGPDHHPALAPGDAELMRVFVSAAHRRLGCSRLLLAELERTAAAAGRTRMVLETGTPQPAAIALYTATGYVPISGFGHYRDSPLTRSYAKRLSSAAPVSSTDRRDSATAR
ncbi:GNAT family N-acetyltransferase [Pseudonocardia sp. GCM10023141]|uniref:GNAT family N-acetyltransferase n=1 Tax=Pseudonocardia sp. GCM10023141 TaxID=3252653 RepID=UPI003612D58E